MEGGRICGIHRRYEQRNRKAAMGRGYCLQAAYMVFWDSWLVVEHGVLVAVGCRNLAMSGRRMVRRMVCGIYRRCGKERRSLGGESLWDSQKMSAGERSLSLVFCCHAREEAEE